LGSYEVKPAEAKQPENSGGSEPKPVEGVKPREPIIYQTGRVQLSHFGAGLITSEIQYVGNDRESWLKAVSQALPINILKLSKDAG